MPTQADERRSAHRVPLDEERAVVARLREGDRAAFAILYRWYGDAVYRAILQRLPRPEAAEDCLRHTFRRALEQLDDFAQDGPSIYFWLRRIGVELANRARDRRRGTPPPQAHAPSPGPRRKPAEAVDDIQKSLGRIAPRSARALRLRLVEEQPREVCARLMDVTVAHFDIIFHRAMRDFRQAYPP